MADLLSALGLDAVLTEPAATGYVLWYRPSTGRTVPWQPVAAGATERQCLDQLGIGDRRHGAWLVLPAGVDPDA